MGMYFSMNTLSDENIDRLLDFPPLVWKVVAPDDPERFDEEVQVKPGWLDRLLGRTPPAPTIPPFSLQDGEVFNSDLDKAWHGIHYLLTGSDWQGTPPLDFIIRGGHDIGNIDLGYGPARAFTAAETAALQALLADWDEDTLRSRYNPDEMLKLDIYPRIWDFDPAEDDAFGYCADYFRELQQFLARATERRLGMIVYTA